MARLSSVHDVEHVHVRQRARDRTRARRTDDENRRPANVRDAPRRRPIPDRVHRSVDLRRAAQRPGPWQGAFRNGWLDLVLLRYAIEACGGVDALPLTHLDTRERMPTWRVCTRYADRDRIALGPSRDLAYVEALGRALRRVEPVYE